MTQTEQLRENIVEPICQACLPYICAHWDLPPRERLTACKPLRDWTDQILQACKEAGLLFADYSTDDEGTIIQQGLEEIEI